MRRVYTPPTSTARWHTIALSAMAVTLLVFLVLPLTQMVSSHVQRKRQLAKIDTATIQPPPPSSEPPPPPPEPEEPEEPPEPNLDDTAQPLNLNFNLDVAMGEGGVLSSLMSDEFTRAADSLKDLAFSMEELDKQPTLIASVSPRYPAEMKKNKIEGSVVILFLLNTSGRVEDPRIERSSRPEFEKPALEAVRKWKFKPGLKNGDPVKTYMRLPIRFRISA